MTAQYQVVGYEYHDKSYCKNCIVDVLKKQGDLYRKFEVTDINETLDHLADSRGLDRHDIWETMNTEVPKEIFDIDAEYELDLCSSCDNILGAQ